MGAAYQCGRGLRRRAGAGHPVVVRRDLVAGRRRTARAWATSRSASSTSGGCHGTADPAGSRRRRRAGHRPRQRTACARVRRLRRGDRGLDLRGRDPVRGRASRRSARSPGAPDRARPKPRRRFVVPVEPDGDHATYVWDTSVDHVTPNTLVTYRWRATDGDEVVLGSEETIRYEDDRPGLDWQHAQLGEATVHWYGDAEAQARRFGELTAVGVARAEELLGTELAGPVDVFVYDSREDFFGALGPGAREWTGAAAYSELRTIFMWLGGGSAGVPRGRHGPRGHPHRLPRRDRQPVPRAGALAERGHRDLVGDERRRRAARDRRVRGRRRRALLVRGDHRAVPDRRARRDSCRTPRAPRWSTSSSTGTAARRSRRIAAAYRDGASDAEALEAGTGSHCRRAVRRVLRRVRGRRAAADRARADRRRRTSTARPAGEIDEGGVDPGARGAAGRRSGRVAAR